MLVDYTQRELADGSRTVVETEHWLAVVLTGRRGRLRRYCCRKPMYSALPNSATPSVTT